MMKSTKKCPSFSTISSAADGNEVAIEKIMTLTYQKPAYARSMTNTGICISCLIWN